MSVVQHTEVNTADLEVARDRVASLFCEHRLHPEHAGGSIAMSLRADVLGPISVVHLDYGAPVRIEPDPLTDFYLVQVPRSGVAQILQDGKRVLASPSQASVLSPTGQVAMTWSAGNPHLCLALCREVVEREATLLLGSTLDAPLVFDLGMHLEQPGNASWLRSLLFLVDELRSGTSITQRRELVDSFAATLAGQLLLGQPHNYSERICADQPLQTSQVQQAVDYIEANLGDDGLSVPMVAKAAGLGVRSLQEAFRRELGVTPVAYVRNRRMLIAHRRLLAADPSVSTVTRIALGVGISHLGRFSVEYRERFGEPPSATLARRSSGLSGAH